MRWDAMRGVYGPHAEVPLGFGRGRLGRSHRAGGGVALGRPGSADARPAVGVAVHADGFDPAGGGEPDVQGVVRTRRDPGRPAPAIHRTGPRGQPERRLVLGCAAVHGMAWSRRRDRTTAGPTIAR